MKVQRLSRRILAVYGKFYSPEEVAGKLIAMAKSKKLGQMRISGNEGDRATGILFRTPGLEVIHDKIPESSMTAQALNNTFRNFDYLRIK